MPQLVFRNLMAGETFKFLSERTFPNSGMAKGPWIKKGKRAYALAADPYNFIHRHTVGSIHVEVERVVTYEKALTTAASVSEVITQQDVADLQKRLLRNKRG